MKRKLQIQSGLDGVRITVDVTIVTEPYRTRDQVEQVREELGDRLMEALRPIAWAQTPLSKMRVR